MNAKDRTRPSPSSLPVSADNPFLVPAWDKPLAADLSLPRAPGLDERLTKGQKLVYQEGQTQLLKQHFQHIKAGYATAASGQIEDLANRVYVQVATNMGLRTTQGLHPAGVQHYLELYMDASLRRFAPELLQIASDHHRSQHDIAAEVIEINEDDARGFWGQILKAAGRRS